MGKLMRLYINILVRFINIMLVIKISSFYHSNLKINLLLQSCIDVIDINKPIAIKDVFVNL